MVYEQTYDPYGNPLYASSDAYGYTGEWWVEEIGLLHLRARWYDPASGTFLSKDPFEGSAFVPQSMNGFNYVHGNPVNWTDPSGEVHPVVAAAAVGAIIGAVSEGGMHFMRHGDLDPALGQAIIFGATRGIATSLVGYGVGRVYPVGHGLRSAMIGGGITGGTTAFGEQLFQNMLNGCEWDDQLIVQTLQGTFLGVATGGIGYTFGQQARTINILKNATPTGSALKKDLFHRSATWMRDYAIRYGKYFSLKNNDGVTRTLVQVRGHLNGKPGRFEYIFEQGGRKLVHQRFVLNGTINGIPNVP